MRKVIVIGAGPAGMMASIQASRNAEVLLLEQNEKIGKKLYITGKGRCNITNAANMDVFIENVNSNPYFMYSAFYRFTNQDTMNFFEMRQLKLKVERGMRVFPKSDKSSDVIKVFEKELRKSGVDLHLQERVLSVTKDTDFIVTTNRKNYRCDKVIIATGGKTYPTTGSTGFGYEVAQTFGHSVTPLCAGLVPLRIRENVQPLKGISLKNITLTAWNQKRAVHSLFGEMLFTDKGLTGPVSLTMSSIIGKHQVDRLTIDLKPALDKKQLDERLLRDFHAMQNKNIENILKELLINKLISYVLAQAHLSPYEKAHEMTREKRHRLVHTIKNLSFTYAGLYPIQYGIVTNGGVSIHEIDPQTMQSKVIDGLYFAGEVLDVDAFTGGYNLQIAFSTGYVAGGLE